MPVFVQRHYQRGHGLAQTIGGLFKCFVMPIVAPATKRIGKQILDRFLQSFHSMKALDVQMMDRYLISQFVNGRCHGNQNNVERNEKVMKVD